MDILTTLAQGIGTTVGITVCALLVGMILGVPLVLLRRSRSTLIRWAVTLVIELVRSIPPIVWLFIIYYGISIGGFQFGTFAAAVIGLGLISGAYLAEIYRASLDAVPAGQWEAAGALGFHGVRTYTKVILPQGLLLTVPPVATYAIGLLKDSAVASVIGAVDVTFLAFQQSRQGNQGLTIFLVAAAIYLVLSIPIAAVARFGGAWIERRLTA